MCELAFPSAVEIGHSKNTCASILALDVCTASFSSAQSNAQVLRDVLRVNVGQPVEEEEGPHSGVGLQCYGIFGHMPSPIEVYCTVPGWY